MSQFPKLYHEVIKELQEGPLYGEIIIERMEKRLGEEKYPKHGKKAYTKAFTRLLKDKRIQIDDYVGEPDQSLDAKDFKYNLIRNNPSDISILINNMEMDVKAKNTLKSCFNIRIKQMKEKVVYWGQLLESSEERCLTQEELEFLESGRHFEYNLNKQIFRKRDYRIEDGKRYSILFSFVDDKQKAFLKKKYKNARIYFFDPKLVGEVSFRKNPNDSVILDKNFFKSVVTPERLFKEYGIYPPFSELDDTDILFEKILTHIITQPEKYKHSLFEDLAWALSDEKDADKYLNQIIEGTGIM
jgi:hypothetical protein